MNVPLGTPLPRVELDAGTVLSSETHPHEIGQFRYVISYIFEDEYSLPVWDGDNHSAAVLEALDIARRCECPAFDLTGRAH